MKLTELTPEEKEVFKKATKPIWDKYRQPIGPELFDFLIAKVNKYAGK